MKKSHLFALGCTCLTSFASLAVFTTEAWSQVSSAKAAKNGVQSVQVSGMRDQDWKPYRTLLRGLDAFETNRFLAPETVFKFVLRPQSLDVDLKQIELKVVGETVALSVALDSDGSFALPRNQMAFDEDAELVLNQRQRSIRWNLLAIRTRGMPDHHRRIGDLRLTCEVFAAMEDWEKLKRQLGLRGVNSTNACISPRLHWTFFEARTLKSARLVNDQRSENLRLTSDGKGFIVYLFDQSWSDHSLIHLEFADGDESLDRSQ